MNDELFERFFRYVQINTRSDDATGQSPSTPGQWDLARLLEREMRELGLLRVRLSAHCVLTGELDATPGCENAPALGFLAHLDTSDAASGENVHPRTVEFQGAPIALGTSGKVLDPALFPELARQCGRPLIVTDGTTLLGADDKAGIAEIMTAMAHLIQTGAPHGKLVIAFTPDEEIGEGTRHFDTADFGARYAYTVDGGAAGEIEAENFNAAQAQFTITGRAVHPGSAKNIMVNAQKIAFRLDAMLPPDEVPEKTEGREGFYHLFRMSGDAGKVQMSYLLRDHDGDAFAARKARCREICDALNAEYGDGTVALELRDQYRNMAEVIRLHPLPVEIAEAAIRRAGLEPVSRPIRGGTDGAMLSFRGLPCPNLGTGGYNFHGECEYASMAEMKQTVQIIENIVAEFAKR